jgi:tRNA dimethylallyltransferase
MVRSNQKSVLLIAGPTASGKSALAVEQAKLRGGVIINADASQIYRELQIVSARPTIAEMDEFPHLLYGHVAGDREYSVGAWLVDVEQALIGAWADGKLPIIVGGTGLYFMALEKGLAKIPPITLEIREKWRGFEGDLHAVLQAKDYSSAERLNPADRQRLIRALEVIESTGKPLRQWQTEAANNSFLKGIAVERIYMQVPREELYVRADLRFDKMLEQGAVEEVRALPRFNRTQPIMKAIGVPELLRHLCGEIDIVEATDLAKIATRQYIKRQLTWFRGQMKDWQT